MRWLFLALLITTLVFAYNACEPEYNLYLKIRVVDEQFRPVPNAYVSLTYQVSKTVHSLNETADYRTTPLKQTNASGLVTFHVVNKEKDVDNLDCKIKVHITKFRYAQDFEIDLHNLTYESLFKVPFYRLTLKAVKDDKPISARFIVENESYEGSSITLSVPEGYVSGYMFYEGIKRFFNITVSNDTVRYISATPLKAHVKIVNSFGEPVDGFVEINGKNYTGQEFDIDLPYYGYVCIAGASNITKRVKIESENTTIAFDREAPFVKVLRASYNDTIFEIEFSAIDEGAYASGIKEVNVIAVHRKPLFGSISPIGYNTYLYSTKVSNLTDNITFTIKVEDNEGNVKIVEGKYIVEKKEENKEETGDLTFVYVIIGVVLLVLLYFAFIKLKDLLSD